MSDRRQDKQARVIHVFSSPLTAMRGAIDLLRHPRRMGDDPLTRDLIDTLERNYTRLSVAIDALLKNARVGDTMVEIVAPLEAFGIEEPPAASEPAPEPPASADTSENRTTTMEPATHIDMTGRVLIVADRPERYHALVEALRDAGYGMLHAGSGIEGIDQARDQRPDMIIIDYALAPPGASGIAKILRDDPDTKALSIVYATEYPNATVPLPRQIEPLDLNQPTQTLVGLIRHVIAAARGSANHAARVLVVDDDTDIQRIVMLRLQQDGYRVVQASNGTEALIAAQKQTFDLIILDLLLPDIDGFSVLGALRARTATTTPIILLSARDSAPEKVRGLQLGADDYVTKPFSPAELQARVRAALRRYEREAGANPSTRLPGNIAIEHALRHRIEQHAPFAVCYADIDNFKAYNDTYSFFKGDAVIQQTAHVLVEAIEQSGNHDDFVGHIGGDDFVVITTPECAEHVSAEAIARFDVLAPLFYDAATRQRGYIDAHDRQGRPIRYPFVSLSIGIVSTARHPIQHVAEVAQRSLDPKKRAKELPGSRFVVED